MASERRTRSNSQPSVQLTALLLTVAVTALAAACGQSPAVGDGEREASVYGFRLEAHGGVPALEVAAQLSPPADTASLTQATAQLLVDALRSCAAEAAGLESTLTLVMDVRGGVVAAPTDARAAAAAADRCLRGSLHGKAFPTPAATHHQLTLQLAKARS